MTIPMQTFPSNTVLTNILNIVTPEQIAAWTLNEQRLVNERVAAEAALNQERIQTQELQAKHANLERAYDVLSMDSGDLYDENKRFIAQIEALQKTNQQQSDKLRDALAEIARLEALVSPKPPTEPEVPVEPKPDAIISKTELRNVAGMCITLGLEAPSAKIDATARELMLLGRLMGFNVVRFFRNKDEVRDDLKRTTSDPRHLYSFAHANGFVVVADTINDAAMKLSDADLSQYLAGLESLGAKALIFDDANQYREPRKDGTRYPPNALENMVGRVRQFSKLPLIASLRADAAIGAYKPLFDFVEFQTFGKPAELDQFLDRGADAYVLDGQASVSLDYLRKAHDIILKDNPAALFWYTALDSKTNWLNMDDKTALIEKTVKAWKEARRTKS